MPLLSPGPRYRREKADIPTLKKSGLTTTSPPQKCTVSPGYKVASQSSTRLIIFLSRCVSSSFSLSRCASLEPGQSTLERLRTWRKSGRLSILQRGPLLLHVVDTTMRRLQPATKHSIRGLLDGGRYYIRMHENYRSHGEQDANRLPSLPATPTRFFLPDLMPPPPPPLPSQIVTVINNTIPFGNPSRGLPQTMSAALFIFMELSACRGLIVAPIIVSAM